MEHELRKVGTSLAATELILRLIRRILEARMKKPVLLICTILAASAFAGAAPARHYDRYHHHHWVGSTRPVPPPESLTSVGTPDCHAQGRFLRIAHHCPPDAIAAARRW